MKYIFIVLGLLLMFDLSAQTDRRLVELLGTISDKYPIKMILTIQNDKILGYYYYEKYKTKILLVGQIKGTEITLNESSDYESDFKIGFIGDFKDKMIIGNWIDKDKNKTLNFKMSLDSDKNMSIDNKIIGIEGKYENIYNSEKFKSSVKLKYINENLFCFEVSSGTESGCVGYLKGLVDLKNLKNGIYSTNLCKELNISIDPDKMIVTEKDCDLHGMNCSFDGEYRKK